MDGVYNTITSDICLLEKGAIRMLHTTNLELFAGIPVADYAAALEWYERLLGSPPTFFPNDIEAVGEVVEHRVLVIAHRPGERGHRRHPRFVDGPDALVPEIAEPGTSPGE